MNRNSGFYRFLKTCEIPPENSRFWLFISTAYNIGMIVLGRMIFSTEYRKEKTCVLVAPFSMGDTLLLYRSFDELQVANAIDTPVILAERSLVRILRELGLKDAIALPSWKIIAMSKALLFSPERYPHAVMSQPWHFFDIRHLNPRTKLKSLPYTLSEETRKRLFPENAMKGNSIVLSPYEQTYLSIGEPQLPMSFWEALAEALAERGYCVFTNCDGKKETAIRNTRVFFPPLVELAGALDYAGGCISVRSGFTDWASSTRTAKQVVLYPSEAFYTRFRMDFVWGKNDIKEQVYDLAKLEILKDELLDCFNGSALT